MVDGMEVSGAARPPPHFMLPVPTDSYFQSTAILGTTTARTELLGRRARRAFHPPLPTWYRGLHLLWLILSGGASGGSPDARMWTISPPMLALLLRDAPLHLPIISFRAAPFGCFAPPAPALSLCPRIPTTLFSSCPRSRLGVLTFSREPHRGCPPFRRGSPYTPPLPVFSRHPSLPLSRAPPFTHAVRRFHRKIRMPARAKA